MITSKLKFHRVKISNYKRPTERFCAYCDKPSKEFILVTSNNDKIFELFDRSRGLHPDTYYLCPECFEKLHPILEEIEAEGWETLDPDSPEFQDLESQEDEGEKKA